MTKAPILIEIERRKKVAGIIRDCLRPYGAQDQVDETKLQFSKNYVSEISSNERTVSRAILDTMFPREQAPCNLYHYTSVSKLRSIATSGEIRLYAVRKRMGGQGELQTFAKAHGLTGYLDSSQGPPFIEELSDDLFYVSMTRLPPKDPSLMWGVFAEGTGARLKFKITPKAAELRSIQYETPSRTLLNEITTALNGVGEPFFLPWTISRIGAFYLPSTVQSEDEVRLLMKRFPGGPNPVRNDGTNDYWPVPIGRDNPICRLDIEEVHLAPSAVRADVEAAISDTALARITITGP